MLNALIDIAEEKFVMSRTAAAHDSFARLGFTDAAILSGSDDESTLSTVDLDLHLQALRHDKSSENFNHIRDEYLGSTAYGP